MEKTTMLVGVARIAWIALAAMLIVAPSMVTAKKGGQQQPKTVVIEIDHRTQIRNPAGRIQLAEGDLVKVILKNTNTTCFDYNGKQVLTQDSNELAGPDTTVEWIFEHYEDVAAYQIEATRKAGTANRPKCKALSEMQKRIEVLTQSWTVGFAGAYLGDELTNPVFFLEKGSRTVQDAQGMEMDEQGFFIRQNPAAEDSFNLGTAAMIHLYHSDSTMFTLGRAINWAPISFGLGVDTGSEARYYLGTSFKFGSKLFVSIGRAFGSVSRLPDSIAAATGPASMISTPTDGRSNFTTDQNALGSLPTRTDDAWFLGLSYTFISVGKERFEKPFKESKPAPSGDGTGEPGDSEGEAKLVITGPDEISEGCEKVEIEVKAEGLAAEAEAEARLVVTGTATKGDDYEDADQTLTFDTSNASRKIAIKILSDDEEEAEGETLEIKLENVEGASYDGSKPKKITIIDGDCSFEAAGVVPFAPSDDGPKVLLGKEGDVWADFVGSREEDETAPETAAREFAEESRHVYGKRVEGDNKDWCVPEPTAEQKEAAEGYGVDRFELAHRIWQADGEAYVYVTEVDPEGADCFKNAFDSDPSKEKSNYHWFSLADLSAAVEATGDRNSAKVMVGQNEEALSPRVYDLLTSERGKEVVDQISGT